LAIKQLSGLAQGKIEPRAIPCQSPLNNDPSTTPAPYPKADPTGSTAATTGLCERKRPNYFGQYRPSADWKTPSRDYDRLRATAKIIMTYLRKAHRTYQFKFVIQQYQTTIPQVALQIDSPLSLDVPGLHLTFESDGTTTAFPLTGYDFADPKIGTLHVYASKHLHGYHAYPTIAYLTKNPDAVQKMSLPIFECFFYLQQYIGTP
jgi:hypothetical protein